MNVKQLALHAVFLALVIVIYLLLPPLYLLVFIVFVLSLDTKGSILFGLAAGIMTGIVSPKFMAFSNIIWLPMIAFGIKSFEVFIYGGKLRDGCLSKKRRFLGLRLGIVTFGLLVITNVGSEIIVSQIQQLGWAYVLVSLPFALGISLATAIIIGLVGIYIQKRISKIIYRIQQ